MNGPSSLVLALGVLNLLLVGAGLLMVYFDWSAARRREFLYLYFTEERPGANYFYSAKRRRAQFSRLLAAFSVLLLQQILSAWALASVADASTWDEWQNWWQDGQMRPSISSAVSLSPWIYYLEVLGLGLLAFGFLYPHTNERAGRHDVFAAAFVALWAVFVLILSLIHI